MSNEAMERDVRALQGIWQQVAFERDGVDDPPDTHGVPESLTVITGHRYSVWTPQGDQILQGSFVLDLTVSPPCITWTDDEGPEGARSLTCSYRLEGDTFQFIGAATGPRPTEFKTGPGQQMRRFVRHR